MSTATTTPHTPWPTVKLGDVCEIVSVRGHQIKQNEIKPTGRYPVVSQSERKIEGYSDEPIAIKDVPLILFGDHTCCVKFIDFPFIVGADGTKLLRPNMMELNYFRYCLENARESLCDGKYRRHFSDLIEMEIPLPPLEVQREIVAKVEAGLKEADGLAAHFKRLAALADDTFKAELDETFSTLNAPTVKLGDVCEEIRERISTDAISLETYITTDNMLKSCGGVKVAESLPPNTSLVRYKCGDILLSNIRPYLKKLWCATCDGGCSSDVIVFRRLRGDLDSNYLYQVLSQEAFFDYVMQNVSGTKMPRGKREWIKGFAFPLPSLDIQQEIVGKLEAVKARCEQLKAEAERGLKAAEALRKAVLAEAFEQ